MNEYNYCLPVQSDDVLTETDPQIVEQSEKYCFE